MDVKCPGQDWRFWRSEDIFEVACPNCKAQIEFFKDESRRICRSCKQEVVNPQVDFGCAFWCPKAKECLGEGRYQQLLASAKERKITAGKFNAKRELLLAEMKNYFGRDIKRIIHAEKVLDFAEQLLRAEEADPAVVIAAAILHDIGIHKAEEKHKSSSGKFQEIEGPPIAREILKKLQFPQEIIDEVCVIIANHHSPGKVDTNNFKVLYDADWLVNLKDEFPIKDKEKLLEAINRIFLTESGRQLAKKIYF